MRNLLLALLVNLTTVAVSQTILPDSVIVVTPTGDTIRYVVPNEYVISATIEVDSIITRSTTTAKKALLNQLDLPVSTATQTALNSKQATLVNQTNLKSVNGNSLLGSGDIPISGTAAWGSVTGTLSDQTDLQTALNLKANAANAAFTGTTTGITAAMVGLGNVTNESKATMFASPTFTGTPVVPSTITVGGNAIVFPAVAATLLPNTSTAGVGTSPTASSTVTITHNLGRVPTIIRIYGYGTFTANAAATATTSSMGIWNSSGNFCVYQRYGAAITTTQAGLSSNAFAILLATGGGNFISGVIQNVTSTGFDVAFTETGTATAQPYLWEAQQP